MITGANPGAAQEKPEVRQGPHGEDGKATERDQEEAGFQEPHLTIVSRYVCQPITLHAGGMLRGNN